ncbi:SIMPL domain-containing protein [Streptomyces roseifaciens]
MTTPTPLPYGTPDTPRVSVRGEARLEVDPEIARLGITVTARGTDRTTTLHDLTQRNSRALDLVKSYGDAVEKIETGYLSITPQLTEKGRGERISAYNGSIHLTATVNDFTQLGELTARLADLPLTRISGPWWALRPDSPAHTEVRRKAVREAVQRARAYADALGTELGALLELADDGAEHATRPSAPGVMRRGRPGGGGFAGPAAPAPELDLEPQQQTVRAQVSARFTMAPPQL